MIGLCRVCGFVTTSLDVLNAHIDRHEHPHCRRPRRCRTPRKAAT